MRDRPGGQFGGGERVAAEVEERFGDRHLVGAEQPGVDLGDLAFGVGFGCDVVAFGQLRRGQSAPVHLAGLVERHLGDRHPHRGPHVFGQHPGDRVLATSRSMSAGDRYATRWSPPATLATAAAAVTTPGTDVKHGLDLAEFEALTAQLHLEVAAAQVFDVAAGVPAGQVAGAVQA